MMSFDSTVMSASLPTLSDRDRFVEPGVGRGGDRVCAQRPARNSCADPEEHGAVLHANTDA
jgi:hypothetical protein